MTNRTQDFKLVSASARPDLLDAVVTLADKNTKWLGLLPRDAIRQSAEADQIILAVDHSERELLGYLLYYFSRIRAKIVHLCTNEGTRKQGIGRSLIDELKRRAAHLDGITLLCRRDYPACAFYSRVGFQAVGQREGRGKRRSTLIHFWFGFDQATLFTESERRRKDNAISAVIDANVFFGLDERSVDPLVAPILDDWLTDEVNLCITQELQNEILRGHDSRSKRSLQRTQQFERLPSTQVSDPLIVQDVEAVLGPRKSQDTSDLKHLLAAADARVPLFLTLDERMYKRRDKIQEILDIKILKPIELVIHLDEIRRNSLYEPERLGGTACTISPVRSSELRQVIERFHQTSMAKRYLLDRRITSVLGQRQHPIASQILLDDGAPVALVVLDETARPVVHIPILRLLRHPFAPTIARFVAVYAVRRSLMLAGHFCCSLIIVDDEELQGSVADALSELGFLQVGGKWQKINLIACGSVSEIDSHLTKLHKEVPEAQALAEMIHSSINHTGSEIERRRVLLGLEQSLFPAYVADDALPTYIVPIQPRWAQHLFDEQRAREQLFAAESSLALNWKNAYYRSGTHSLMRAPGHVLWYVSEGKGAAPGPSAITACASIDETRIGEPKHVFGVFSRLGVFGWSDVKSIADKAVGNRVEAFRFGPTVCFPNEVKLQNVREILARHGKGRPTLQAPIQISSPCFREIYERGFQIRTAGTTDIDKAALR